MTEDNPENRQIDEQLAEFTDQILDRSNTGEPALSPENEELRKLQKVVVQLKRTGATSHPAPSFMMRLRNRLNMEWRHTYPPVSQASTPSKVNFFQKIQQYFERTRPRTLALQLSAAAVLLVLVGLLIAPQTSDSMTGAAGLSPSLRPLLLGLALLGVLVVLWLNRPKNQ